MDANIPTLLQYLPLAIAAVLVGYVVYRDQKKEFTEAPKLESPKIAYSAKAEVPKVESIVVDPKEAEVVKAKVALDTAGIKGTERLQTIAAVRDGKVTGDEVVEAHRSK